MSVLGVLIDNILYRELVIKGLEKPNGQRKDNETMQRFATESHYPVPQKSSAQSYLMILSFYSSGTSLFP